MKLITHTLCALTTIIVANAQVTTTYDLGSWSSGFGDGSFGSSTGSNAFPTPSSINGVITDITLCYTINFDGMVAADNHCVPDDGGPIIVRSWDGFYSGLTGATGIKDEDQLHSIWAYDRTYGVITAADSKGTEIYYDVDTTTWNNVYDATGTTHLLAVDDNCPDLNWTGEVGVSFYLPGGDQIDATTDWAINGVAPGDWLMTGVSGGSNGGIVIDPADWASYLDGSLDVNNSIFFTSAADTPQTSGATWSDTINNGNGDFNYTVDFEMKVTTVVPEPSSVALISLGSLALLRRKRKA